MAGRTRIRWLDGARTRIIHTYDHTTVVRAI
jgi:hypothetical protein